MCVATHAYVAMSDHDTVTVIWSSIEDDVYENMLAIPL